MSNLFFQGVFSYSQSHSVFIKAGNLFQIYEVTCGQISESHAKSIACVLKNLVITP